MMKQAILAIALLCLCACSPESSMGPAPEPPVSKPVALDHSVRDHDHHTLHTYSAEQTKIFDAFGWSKFDPATIKTTRLEDGLAVIFGYGGNILVSVGDDGVLMIDNQMPQIHAALLDEVKKLGGDQVDYVINTHWHFDHAEGNLVFGPLGAEIIAHENSRKYMAGAHDVNMVLFSYPQQAYPKVAIPKISYTETMNMAFNGDELTLHHFGPAHTTGDTIVYFKQANGIHMGDVANPGGAPFIDADNGGSIDGMIKSVREVLNLIDEETVVVPGHGDITDRLTLETFVSNLETARDRIAQLKAQGLSLEQIQRRDVAGEFFGQNGPLLVDRAYHSMR